MRTNQMLNLITFHYLFLSPETKHPHASDEGLVGGDSAERFARISNIVHFYVSRDKTTARANTSTMHSCMARAIQGTVGCRQGNGYVKRCHKLPRMHPIHAQFLDFIFPMTRMGCKLDKPLITLELRGCNIFSAHNSSPDRSDRPASHCVVVLVTCDQSGGILYRSKSWSRPGAQPGRVAGPHNASG